MKSPEIAVWVLCTVAVLLDTATTVVGLHAGCSEQNPFLRSIIDCAGISGFVTVQLLFIAGPAVLRVTQRRKHVSLLLVGYVGTVSGIAAAHNLAVLWM